MPSTMSEVDSQLKFGEIIKGVLQNGWYKTDRGYIAASVVKVVKKYNMTRPMFGVIRSRFGPRIHPVTKEPGRFHYGVDIANIVGVEIISPADGKVLDVYTHEFGGKSLIILHDNGLESRMCHLHDWKVKKGDEVKQGQVVAINGNTGRSTGPHLHYGIRNEDKVYIDPQTIINF
jgi:murein DD-endopeptidase MepM/ murein hydrolase activator NlpD